MLSAELNETLTRVGPGTRMGALLRRYWYPVAGLAEFETRWSKKVRLLGENLVLFKDRAGRFGLLDERCPHRGASLYYGIPTEHGWRCPYHGWHFDHAGRCVDQPNEARPDALNGKALTAGYPVETMGGLVWAYLGPQPAPLVPDWEPFSWEDGLVQIVFTYLACNWFQCQENSIDPADLEWLQDTIRDGDPTDERGPPPPLPPERRFASFDVTKPSWKVTSPLSRTSTYIRPPLRFPACA